MHDTYVLFEILGALGAVLAFLLDLFSANLTSREFGPYDDAVSYLRQNIYKHRVLCKRERFLVFEAPEARAVFCETELYETLSSAGGSWWVVHTRFGLALVTVRTQFHDVDRDLKTHVNVRLFGGSHRDAEVLCAELLETERRPNPRYLKSYLPQLWDGGGDWIYRMVPRRNWSTFFLPKHTQTALRQFIQTFLSSELRDVEEQRVHKTSLLLSGPPGTGKSTIPRVLATEYDLNLHTICLSDTMDEEQLLGLMFNLPNNGKPNMVVFEEIDTLSSTEDRRLMTDDAPILQLPGIGLGTLLNVLCGAMTPDNTIFVAITNYPERLDSALVRPGRMDQHITIGATHREQLNAYCAWQFGAIEQSRIDEALRDRRSLPSMATVEAIGRASAGNADKFFEMLHRREW